MILLPASSPEQAVGDLAKGICFERHLAHTKIVVFVQLRGSGARRMWHALLTFDAPPRLDGEH
eukprot:7264388-Prorocentrum_lima.AAC.1